MREELEEVEIAERLCQDKVGEVFDSRKGVEDFFSSRVDRENYGKRLLNNFEGIEKAGEDGRVVNVGRAVKGEDGVWFVIEIELMEDIGFFGLDFVFEEGVNHNVSDEEDFFLWDAFVEEVLDG